jgi:hypothetical protein
VNATTSIVFVAIVLMVVVIIPAIVVIVIAVRVVMMMVMVDQVICAGSPRMSAMGQTCRFEHVCAMSACWVRAGFL